MRVTLFLCALRIRQREGLSINSKKPLTYSDAGVDIDRGNQAVKKIAQLARTTYRPEVRSGVGGFAGSFHLSPNQILLAGTDGVGSKLLIAQALARYDTVGIDLVAMNVNDVLASGGEPLLFLDYLAVGYLDPERVATLVAGVVEGCNQAGCALLGGETAELPDIYGQNGYDLAGFVVGRLAYDPPTAQPGDHIIGIASSGFHSNGYALIRAVIDRAGLDLSGRYPETGSRTLGEILLEPTRIYVRPIMDLWAQPVVRAMAHITGGGLLENLGRTLPEGMGAELAKSAWERSPVFNWFQRLGEVDDAEMYRTFNMGIGFTVVVAPDDVSQTIAHFSQYSLRAYDIGRVVDHPGVSLR